MLANLAPAAIGAIFLAAAVTLYVLGKLARVTALLLLIGAVMIGSGGGVINHMLSSVTGGTVHLSDHVLRWAFGLSAGGLVLAIPAIIIVAHDLHPKHAAGRRTIHFAAVLGLLIATGLTGISALAGSASSISNNVTNTVHGL